MPASRARVLVVEREESLRGFLEEALACEGHTVFPARDGDAALQLFRREKIDIAIADIFLPGLNGLELLKRVKEEGPSVEVILIGHDVPVQTVVTAMKEGAYDYIEKPIDVERLRLVVEKALERAALEKENAALRRISDSTKVVPDIVCSSDEMREVLKTVQLVAPTDLTVLIEGESGVGKELVAHRIHKESRRAGMPFIAINCGVLQENLLESELFGHEKGAFTGAVSDHAGLFEIADHGTLFLDEIGELSLDLQVKLLRVLETGEFRRLGGHKIIRADVRVLAATNKRLHEEVKKGTFREDLYYRLNVIKIEVPPLRRRREEIPALVGAFLDRHRRRGMRERRFAKAALDALAAYHWPGNVRELENLIERTLILSAHDEIQASDLPRYALEQPGGRDDLIDDGDLTLAEMERRCIIRALRRNKGNKVRTARKLGINVKTLYNKIKAYEIGESAIVSET
jgi:DNA-binding NtrC family response regulator